MILLLSSRIPARGRCDEAARLERLAWAETRTGRPLDGWRSTGLDPARLAGNVENLIGSVEIPVGLVGPLLFDGDAARGEIVAPFATTEGALVASACRGASALTAAGGVRTRVLARQMTRVPLFVLADDAAAARFATWVRARRPDLQAVAESATRHGRLLDIEPIVLGRRVHVRFRYATGDAAGQNMTTACTWAACRWIVERLPDARIDLAVHFVEGNLSGDKKVCRRHGPRGLRGARVVAEAVLPAAVCHDVLHAGPAALSELWDAMRAAADRAGMVGHSVNVANAVAAIFAATGQDIACVHESGVAELSLAARGDDLSARLVLPGLIVGTVGGGTGLPAQRTALELLGCAGAGGAARLAEVVTGFALGLELSTLAALASGEFADAHERLGRNRPATEVDGNGAAAPNDRSVRNDAAGLFGPAFFEPGLRRALGDPALRVTAVEPAECATDGSILTRLAGAREPRRPVGLFPLSIRHVDGAGRAGALEAVLKAKPADADVLAMVGGLAAECGPELGEAFGRFRHATDFVGCHVRELAVYEQTDPRFLRHVPRVYGTVRDNARGLYAVVLERLAGLRHMNSVDDVSAWTRADLETALDGIARVHAIWLGREAELARQPWLGPFPTARRSAAMTEWWEGLAAHAAGAFPDLVGPADLRRRTRWIAEIPEWWGRLEAMPRTLVHNDFNPRNVALRPGADGPTLCAYDWELATLKVPQHDLAELLAFVLPPTVEVETVDRLVAHHRRALERASGTRLDAAAWREGYALALRDLALDRIALYLMAHTTQRYAFLPRVVATLHRLLALAGER